MCYVIGHVKHFFMLPMNIYMQSIRYDTEWSKATVTAASEFVSYQLDSLKNGHWNWKIKKTKSVRNQILQYVT